MIILYSLLIILSLILIVLGIFWSYAMFGLVLLSVTSVIGVFMDLWIKVPCKYLSKKVKRVLEKIKNISFLIADKYNDIAVYFIAKWGF